VPIYSDLAQINFRHVGPRRRNKALPPGISRLIMSISGAFP